MKLFLFFGLILVSCGTLKAQQFDSLKHFIYLQWTDTCPPFHVDIRNHFHLPQPEKDDYSYQWSIGDETVTNSVDTTDFIIADTGKYNLLCSVYHKNLLVHVDTIPLSFYCDTPYVYAGPVYYGCGHPDFDMRSSAGCTIEAVLVFDRWGELLFESTGLPGDWGFTTPSGARLKSATYVTVIEFTDQYNNRRLQVKNFSIVY